ncbi:MAG TPA: IclR family transcriptional regulator [Syntrophorhabdaceae bacterium]|jgi:DNA-binding IclR family transcriptional regulator
MNDEVVPSAQRYVVPAVEQASRVLFCLAGAESQYLSLPEICARVAIHKSKAFSILETLLGFGLVRKGTDGKGYALGPGLIFLSRKAIDHLSAPRLAEPILKDLAKATGCTAVLGLIDGGSVFIAGKAEGEGGFGVTMRVGHRLGLTYGAHGKAVVAVMPGKVRDHILAETPLYFYGSPERLDRVRLAADFAQCLEEGFAEDLGEVNPGLNVEAAPVIGPDGMPVGFIEIFVLFKKETAHQFGPLVAEAGRALSRELGASPPAQWALPDRADALP